MAANVGMFGLLFTGLTGADEVDWPAVPIFGFMFLGGVPIAALGSSLMDPKPQAVVDRYNQLLKQ